jgi:hypothetical protein
MHSGIDILTTLLYDDEFNANFLHGLEMEAISRPQSRDYADGIGGLTNMF